MTNEHKHAALLSMAADNEDQLFECEESEGQHKIKIVLQYPDHDWRPVKQTKKIKKWLWAKNCGFISAYFFSETEIIEYNAKIPQEYTIKLEWSETIFEVDDE